jgi:hypothetical protein
VTHVVVTSRADGHELAALLDPQDHFVRERREAPGRFTIETGPFTRWERRVDADAQPDADGRRAVTTTVDFTLAIPLWGPAFALLIRRNLRRKHGLDCTQPVGVWSVYSEEPPTPPQSLAYDDGAFECVCPGGHNGLNDCEHKNRVEGSVAFVPSVFGATAASVAIKLLLGLPLPLPRVADPDAPRPRRPTRLATTPPS